MTGRVRNSYADSSLRTRTNRKGVPRTFRLSADDANARHTPCVRGHTGQWRDSLKPSGKFTRVCGDCSKDRVRRSKYKLCEAELAALIAHAAGHCAACGEASANLHVDHCHSTGNVRGMLCYRCNIGAGFIESPVRDKIVAYLERTNNMTVKPWLNSSN